MSSNQQGSSEPLEMDAETLELLKVLQNWIQRSPDPMLVLRPLKARNLICKDLSVRELLELSTVSTSWFYGIKELPTYKERVWVNINNTSGADQLEFLQRAKDYKNLKILLEIWNGELEQEFFTKQRWKQVKLTVQRFAEPGELVQCLKMFSKTVETLKLMMIKEAGDESDPAFENFLEFPCLKSLHVEECSSTVLKPFMDQKALTNLKLDFLLPSSTNVKLEVILTELVVSLENLVELEVKQSSADDLFSFNIGPYVKFHLKTFIIGRPASEVAVLNVIEFMESQRETLEHVKLCSWDDPSTIYQIWNSMAHLKTLYQSDGTQRMNFQNVEPYLKKIFVNENMKELHFHFTSPEIPTNWLSPLILASPFLKLIQIPKSNELPNHKLIETKFCFLSCDEKCEDYED